MRCAQAANAVFGVRALLEAIMLSGGLSIRDVLAAMQVDRTFYHTIMSSTALRRFLCLASDLTASAWHSAFDGDLHSIKPPGLLHSVSTYGENISPALSQRAGETTPTAQWR